MPQGTTSATKYSRIVILRDREREKKTQWERTRSSGEGFRPEECMDGKRRRKEEREKMAVREQVQGEEIVQKECAEFCCVFCPWVQTHTAHCM